MIRENNHRAHPLGVIQVKKDSSNKIMLRSEGETSDGVVMCLEIDFYQRMSYFAFGVNIVLGVAET